MPSDVDTTQLTLALVLTGAGTTVAATLIASIIEIAKRTLGPIGVALDAGKEGALATILAAVLVGYAYLATTPVPDPFSGFAAFLAWVGIAKLAGAAYDVGAQIKAALPGGG